MADKKLHTLIIGAGEFCVAGLCFNKVFEGCSK